jgi:hypothetical protein
MPQEQTKRTRRRREPEPVSFSEWMACMDNEVEKVACKTGSQMPAKRFLSTAQLRILEMLAEHLRSLPPLQKDESCFSKPQYDDVNVITTILFEAKYPGRRKREGRKNYDVDDLPGDAGKDLTWLLQNCAGRHVR